MIRPIPFLPVNSAGSTITLNLFPLLEEELESILDKSESLDSVSDSLDEDDSLDSGSLSDSLDDEDDDDDDDEESTEDMVEGSDSSEDNDEDGLAPPFCWPDNPSYG
jgi:hypothetical protein